MQGFLRRLGIERSYTMINAYLYSVYGQAAGERYADDEKIAAYRNRWLDALLADSAVGAVVAFGYLGRSAFEQWRKTPHGTHSQLHFEHLTHPTMPEASSKGDPAKKGSAMKRMLVEWNAALERLDAKLGERDTEHQLTP